MVRYRTVQYRTVLVKNMSHCLFIDTYYVYQGSLNLHWQAQYHHNISICLIASASKKFEKNLIEISLRSTHRRSLHHFRTTLRRAPEREYDQHVNLDDKFTIYCIKQNFLAFATCKLNYAVCIDPSGLARRSFRPGK